MTSKNSKDNQCSAAPSTRYRKHDTAKEGTAGSINNRPEGARTLGCIAKEGTANPIGSIIVRETEEQFATQQAEGAHATAGVHSTYLAGLDFHETDSPAGFCPLWHSFCSEAENRPKGHFHVCAPTNRWALTIHDFTLPHDTLLSFKLPEYLSVAWYQSISGEEFTPYRKLRAGSIWGFCSSDEGWRGFIHGGIPVRAVSIEVRPELARAYLESEYGGQFERVRDAYESLNDIGDFPEMRLLLMGLWPKVGDEHRNVLYYEGKVLEALGLIVERTKSREAAHRKARSISPDDRDRILSVISYIDDHCTSTLKVDDLARAACMGPTKFKECFKAVTSVTLTKYVQSRRMSQAENLLRQPDLSIEQVARAVGYTCTSRFSELFRRETGLLPSKYRALML